MSNPFKAIADMYQAQVDEADKSNTAELYKSAFYYIKDKAENNDVYIINEEYLDGYFIFGSGTNSVVHFHVKGCKNWKWGVWWSYDPEKKYKQLTGELFCMHERYLDKFKPTRGTYTFNLGINVQDGKVVDDGYNWAFDNFIKCCHFIQKQPYIAAMKDFHGYDYNYKYQSPVKAFFEYYKNTIQKWTSDTIKNICTKSMYRYLKHYAAEEFEDYEWEIIDSGENCSPRYELQVKLPEDDTQETGLFGLFEDGTDGEKKWDAKTKRLEKLAELFHACWWGHEVSDCVVFWKQSEYEENLRKWVEEDKEDME